MRPSLPPLLLAALLAALALLSLAAEGSPTAAATRQQFRSLHAERRPPSGRPSPLARAKPVSVDMEAALAQIRSPWAQVDAERLIQSLVHGELKGLTYARLANFTDTLGPRLCGSPELEAAVDFMIERLKEDGLENVAAEEVELPYWHRGAESATLLSPRKTSLSMLGLGFSIGTQAHGSQGLTADVLVVRNFDELTARAADAKGKIVVFNHQCDWAKKPTGCYGETAIYRFLGAQVAAKAGGVAALIKTLGGFSINSPHTGSMGYGDAPKIPAASITLEDSEMLQRMQDRGQRVTINLRMEAYLDPQPRRGHNVVAEWRGWEKPEETVLVSGHLDSWDVGVGAMDDGGGAFISWSVLTALRKLNMRPRRTIRLVMWSCEEMGGQGAYQYFDAHQHEVDTMSLVMESDMGVFHPRGLELPNANAATNRLVSEIGKMLGAINATQVVGGGGGVDIDPWIQVGVPGASLLNDNDKYFWFHHSAGDRMEVLQSDEVDRCAAVWAVHAYSVANMESMLPRG